MFKENTSAPESGKWFIRQTQSSHVRKEQGTTLHLSLGGDQTTLPWLCEIANEHQKYSNSTCTEVCVAYGIVTSCLERELEAMVHTWDEIWNVSTSETKLDSSKMPLSAWCSHFLLIDASWYNSISGYLVVHGKESNTTENPAYERMKAPGRCKLQLFWAEFLNPHTAILFFLLYNSCSCMKQRWC